MTIKKALVITNGQIEQLQATDRLASPTVFSRTNANAGALVIGTPVFVAGAGSVDKARANAAGTKDVLGFITDISVATGQPGTVQSDGVLTASTAQWDAVTGQSGGLTPNTTYFLDSAAAGKLTPTAPTADGDFVCPLGLATSPTELEISIRSTIKL
jgi:hypothetical protein